MQCNALPRLGARHGSEKDNIDDEEKGNSGMEFRLPKYLGPFISHTQIRECSIVNYPINR